MQLQSELRRQQEAELKTLVEGISLVGGIASGASGGSDSSSAGGAGGGGGGARSRTKNAEGKSFRVEPQGAFARAVGDPHSSQEAQVSCEPLRSRCPPMPVGSHCCAVSDYHAGTGAVLRWDRVCFRAGTPPP